MLTPADPKGVQISCSNDFWGLLPSLLQSRSFLGEGRQKETGIEGRDALERCFSGMVFFSTAPTRSDLFFKPKLPFATSSFSRPTKRSPILFSFPDNAQIRVHSCPPLPFNILSGWGRAGAFNQTPGTRKHCLANMWHKTEIK